MQVTYDNGEYRVEEAGTLVCTVGFMVVDLMNRAGYIWFKPGPGFGVSKVRELRALFREAKLPLRYVFAACEPGKNARFARFFGFAPMGLTDKGHEIYGRYADAYPVLSRD